MNTRSVSRNVSAKLSGAKRSPRIGIAMEPMASPFSLLRTKARVQRVEERLSGSNVSTY